MSKSDSVSDREAQALRRQLDACVAHDQANPDVQARLAAQRRLALDAMPQARVARPLMLWGPALAAASLVAVFTGLWLQRDLQHDAPTQLAEVEVFELLTEDETLPMFVQDDPEFYVWLEEAMGEA